MQRIAVVGRAMSHVLVDSLVLAIALGVGASASMAHANGLLIVNQPWARPASTGQTTEVYMDITSTAGATLLTAGSDAAATTRIRAPDGSRPGATRVALPAGAVVALAPGGYRIALERLRRTLKLGDRLRLKLIIERGDGSPQEISVDAEVRRHSPIEDELRSHHHPAH